MMQRRYITMIRLTAFDWPSVCGWKAVLIRCFIPASLKRSRQRLVVKTGSRSLMMEVGKPWRRTMPLKKARATDAAV